MEYASQYIPEQLAQEIEDKRLFILSKNPSLVRLSSDNRERRALAKMAQCHSYKMEHPEVRFPHNIPKNNGRKHIKEGAARLGNAFRWGRRNFDPEDFRESFIREIAGRVSPEIYEGYLAQYRNTGVRVAGASTTPPDPYKVREKEIPVFEAAMRERLESPNPMDGLETAIFSHFHITRIHPFEDGNGRTSRIVQDVILDHFSYPLPVIQSGERETYYQLLDRAIMEWKDQNNWRHGSSVTSGELVFYTFVAGKVNTSLDKLIDALSRKKKR